MTTGKLYYKDPYQKEFDAKLLSCEQEGDTYKIVLDQTCFYPEGGGQPADHGELAIMLTGENGAAETVKLEVFDVHEKDGVIVHSCRDLSADSLQPAALLPQQALRSGLVTGRALPALHIKNNPVNCFRWGCGTAVHQLTDSEASFSVHGQLDWDRRFDHMQQHSGEHIVSGMLCSAFHCNNVGFHMGELFVTIDYDAPMTEEDIRGIEDKANRYIGENHPFEELWPTAEELKSIDYRSKKELSGAVRITRFAGADCCACCGTHVKTSSEVGFVKLFSVQKFREGVRIEMMSGLRLFKYLSACHDQNILCSQATSAKPLETGEAVQQMKQEVISLKGRIIGLENETFEYIAASLESVDSPVYFAGPMGSDSLRKLCVKIAARAKGCVTVLAGEGDCWNYAMIEEGADLRPRLTEFNKALNGKGGGRDGYAQGTLRAEKKEILRFLEAGK